MDRKLFFEIENKYNLNNLEIDGVNCWNYYRFTLWNYKICAEQLGLDESHKKSKKSIKELIIIGISIIRNIVSIRQKTYKNKDVLIASTSRRVLEDDYWICPWSECVSRMYEENHAVIESFFEGKHFTPINELYVTYLDSVLISVVIKYYLYKKILRRRYTSIRRQVETEFAQPLKELQDAYSWQGELDESINELTKMVIYRNCAYDNIEKIVSRINPKVIIEICHYSFINMVLTEVGHAQSIPVVELQHGTVYDEHLAYQYSPEHEDREDIRQFPNYILLFSEFWKKRMQPPISMNNLIPVGFPRFEKELEMSREIKKDTSRKTIIFISQGTIGKYLSHLAIELRKLVSLEDFRIIYKLHPSEFSSWKEKFPDLEEKGIEVIGKSEYNLYDLFSISDAQVGVYSTAMYEGIGFGLETFIYTVGHYDMMEQLVESGNAKFVDGAEELAKQLKKPGKNVSEECKNLLWPSDSLTSMRNAIDSIMNE